MSKGTRPKATRPIIRLPFGVWTVTTYKESPFDLRLTQTIRDARSAIPSGIRLVQDLFQLEPMLLTTFLAAKLWSGIKSALLLYLSARLLQVVESCLKQGHTDISMLFHAMGARLVVLIIAAAVEWWIETSQPILKTRMETHCELLLIKANLRIDLPTSLEPRAKFNFGTIGKAWQAFVRSIELVVDMLAIGSQLALILDSSSSSGDPMFAVVCLAKPLLLIFGQRSLWRKAHAAQITNPHYLRLSGLNMMSKTEFRADIISNNLGHYIVKEYENMSTRLGGASDDWPGDQCERRETPLFKIAEAILGYLPMLYYTLQAALNPSHYTLTSIAIMQQSCQSLQYTLESAVHNGNGFHRRLIDIRNLYKAQSVVNMMPSGQRPYPDPQKGTVSRGLALEARNVTFSYPGCTSQALSGATFSIRSGQLVVIVGENGSGKSTIIKLLTRLYDPTSGDVLLDGEPISTYRETDMHDAIATLTQDHCLFPLPVGQNIALGNIDNMANEEMIRDAAAAGGAMACIDRLDDGMDAILDARITSHAYSINLVDDPDDPLQKEQEKIEKPVDVSGGEKQRIVASRTFMRLSSDKIKLIAADEPSSAMDPEAEARLFDRLREAQRGRTMIFVTHRFGHLTKFADQIICMKEGKVCESGTHDELMDREDSAYRRMYEAQSAAFNS